MVFERCFKKNQDGAEIFSATMVLRISRAGTVPKVLRAEVRRFYSVLCVDGSRRSIMVRLLISELNDVVAAIQKNVKLTHQVV